jgi:hypothetical protein
VHSRYCRYKRFGTILFPCYREAERATRDLSAVRRQLRRLPSTSGCRSGAGGGWEPRSCRPVYISFSSFLPLGLLGLDLGYSSPVMPNGEVGDGACCGAACRGCGLALLVALRVAGVSAVFGVLGACDAACAEPVWGRAPALPRSGGRPAPGGGPDRGASGGVASMAFWRHRLDLLFLLLCAVLVVDDEIAGVEMMLPCQPAAACGDGDPSLVDFSLLCRPALPLTMLL